MSKRAEIRQADANRIAKAAAFANVKAEIRLPSGVTVTFAPSDTPPLQQAATSKRQFVL